MNSSKVAIVTAAGKGIGAACARELAAQGWKVSLLSRGADVKTLAAELGGIGRQGSVAVESDLEALVTETVAQYGRIDAVVISTGHPPKGALLALTDADWRTGFDMILLNVIRLARLTTPYLAKQGGSIVNISSFAAREPNRTFPISSALRAALSSFTKMYGEELAPQKVRMNSVLPGFIDSYPETEAIRASIPMGRYGRVAEIAKVVAFLASDAASYLTGESLRVDGGLTRSV